MTAVCGHFYLFRRQQGKHMENLLLISNLNDFVFCPYSIYLHNVYNALDSEQYQQTVQVAGKNAHETIDQATHDTKAHIMHGISVYSEQYGLIGKIDTYDAKLKKLTERKNQIKQIYDGYKLQLYAQYFALIEMGFEVNQIGFYSLKDNKPHPVPIPDAEQTQWFADYVNRIRRYDPSQALNDINPTKCQYCIYRSLCDQTEDE